MADIANGTQFSDLPYSLVREILLRLPIKALFVCKSVRKDWTPLYFSDPYFLRLQLETSKTLILSRKLEEGRNFRFQSIVDEVSTGSLRMETLELSCKFLHDPNSEWFVVNSCNGLLCLIDETHVLHYTGSRTVSEGGSWFSVPNPTTRPSSKIYVCNPILQEWVSIPIPVGLSFCVCALGFSPKDNQYKILLCIKVGGMYTPRQYEWKIYTLGTGQWRSVEVKENIMPWVYHGLDFNTFIHGSLHWTGSSDERGGALVVHSFDFETERFRVLSLLEPESQYIENLNVTLGVINGCLWASFHNDAQYDDGEMWAMKEYGVDKPWSMMLAFRNHHLDEDDDTPNEVLRDRNKELAIYEDSISAHILLFPLNGYEMLTYHDDFGKIICYNIKTERHREMMVPDEGIGNVTAYNPTFVSLHDVARGEEVMRGSDMGDGVMQTKLMKKSKKKTKKRV